MARNVVVQYRTHPDRADENQRLVEAVYAELAEREPDGIRYATFRLDDGVTFIHIALVDGDNPLDTTAAFQEFQRELASRLEDGPRATPASIVGSYRFV